MRIGGDASVAAVPLSDWRQRSFCGVAFRTVSRADLIEAVVWTVCNPVRY